MTGSQPSAVTERAARREGRSRTTLAALVLGMPLAAGILWAVHFGPLRDSPARRYFSHPVEVVEVLMFCAALGALAAKVWNLVAERRACRTLVLPPWDGKAQPVTTAGQLLGVLEKLPRRLQGTLIVRRVTAVLDFLRGRGSAAELDEQLRTLADTDALALESSFGLTKFICWAIPILGFLGTVLGITEAIAGVTPEVLENSLSTVTDGLALAFDTTALALALTMIVMLLSFTIERGELAVLETVDRYADRELAHRFERTGSQGGEVLEVVRRQTDVLVEAMARVVERQAAVWAQALAEVDRRRDEVEERVQERLTAAVETALEKTLAAHAQRLAALEQEVVQLSGGLLDRLAALATVVRDTGREQQAALAQVAQGVVAQAEVLCRLQDGEKQLVVLQGALHDNLTALAGAGAFAEAVHSLTAAIHLLTARAVPAPGSGGRPATRPGAAA